MPAEVGSRRFPPPWTVQSAGAFCARPARVDIGAKNALARAPAGGPGVVPY